MEKYIQTSLSPTLRVQAFLSELPLKSYNFSVYGLLVLKVWFLFLNKSSIMSDEVLDGLLSIDIVPTY